MIDEDTGSGDMCMLYEIQARSELGHDRLGREAVADRGRRRARGRVDGRGRRTVRGGHARAD